jgi:hypothetical protein
VELCNEQELELALTRHNMSIGNRYIEVFRSDRDHFEKHLLESVHNTKNWSSPVVRIRGLPFRCTKQNIIDFFGWSLTFFSNKFLAQFKYSIQKNSHFAMKTS